MNQQHGFTTLSAFFVVLCLCLSACGSHEPSGPVEAKSSSATPSPRSSPRSELEATEPDGDESQAEDVDENKDEEDSDAGYFHGHRCTVDCSGHEAGYEWAEEHDIHDPDECGGKSQSFIEGCRAWAEDNP
jgi:hypothetical protein